MRGRFFSILICALLLVGGGAVCEAQLPEPQPANPLFKDRPFGPRPEATPTPQRKQSVAEEKKPIPRGWIIGGIAAGVLATAGILYFAARHWHSSNLFDRQYRFPVPDQVAVRLGGTKCGGHMATARFGEAKQLPKDA